MRVNSIKFVMLALLISLFSACEEEHPTFEEAVVSLRLNETRNLMDGSTIELSEVEDSRCPEETDCIWEGRASVTLRWSTDEVLTFTLNDVEYVSKEINGYTFTLEELTPFPNTENSDQPKVAKIRIEGY